MDAQSKAKAIPLKRDGLSLLGGSDVGDYPRHSFAHNANIEFERNWPLKVVVVGDDEWVAGCSRFRKRSRIFSLELVMEGSLDFVQSGRRHSIRAGEMLVIQPGQDCEMSAAERVRKKIMILGGYLVPSFVSAGGWEGVDAIRLSRPDLVAGYFDRVYEASAKQPQGYMKYCSAQAYELLLELSSEIGARHIPADLNRILCFMEENMAQELKIALLCQKFGLSSTSLHRLFKRHLGCAPIDYLIRKRVESAKELLLGSSAPIKELAAQLGYANQFFFSTEFKKRVGCSPREFRKASSQAAWPSEPGALAAYVPANASKARKPSPAKP
jgi:AraC-like DNA-binding protein